MFGEPGQDESHGLRVVEAEPVVVRAGDDD